MTPRYAKLLIGIVVVAAVLSILARLAPHGGSSSHVTPTSPAAAPVETLSIEVRGGSVAPEDARVPKDHRVRLTVRNRGSAPARVALFGYQDRLSIPVLAPGGAWSGEFLADRPGDDFAWMIDDKPAGRLSVTGSHLVEGHR